MEQKVSWYKRISRRIKTFCLVTFTSRWVTVLSKALVYKNKSLLLGYHTNTQIQQQQQQQRAQDVIRA